MTRTADHAAFLRAVMARPDDDGPRMLFADWLDDHDQPERAEFIRVQCERATLPPCLCFAPGGIEAGNGVDCRPCILRRRERELLHVHCHRWTAALPRLPAADTGRDHLAPYEFTRGLVSHVTCDWPTWRDHAAAIRAATPLERVTLTTWPGHAGRWTGTQPPTDIWIIPGDGMEEPEGVYLGYERERAVSAMLGRRYSGIAFELPRPE